MDAVDKLVGQSQGGTHICLSVPMEISALWCSHGCWFSQRAFDEVILGFIAAKMKHAQVKTEDVKVDSLEDEWDQDKDKDDQIGFAADGGIVVGKPMQVANWVSKNLLKLRMDEVKILTEQADLNGVHKDHLAKIEVFCNMPEDLADCKKQKLALGLKLMVLIRK